MGAGAGVLARMASGIGVGAGVVTAIRCALAVATGAIGLTVGGAGVRVGVPGALAPMLLHPVARTIRKAVTARSVHWMFIPPMFMPMIWPP